MKALTTYDPATDLQDDDVLAGVQVAPGKGGRKFTLLALAGYFGTGGGGVAWTLESTTNTTSGTSHTITIPTSYDELMFVYKGVSHSAAATPSLRIELSPDGGTTWTQAVAVSATQNASNLVQGASFLVGVKLDRFMMIGFEGTVTLDSDNSGEAATIRNGLFHMTTQPNRARFSWSGGETFDAGSIELHGR